MPVQCYFSPETEKRREDLQRKFQPVGEGLVAIYPTSARARFERRKWIVRHEILSVSACLACSEFEDLILAGRDKIPVGDDEIALAVDLLRSSEIYSGAPSEASGPLAEIGVSHGVLRRLSRIVGRKLVENLAKPSSCATENGIAKIVNVLSDRFSQNNYVYREVALVDFWRNASFDDVRQVFPDARTFVVDGFDEFSESLWSMIEWFHRLGKYEDLELILLFDWSPDDITTYPHLSSIHNGLCERGLLRQASRTGDLKKHTATCVKANVPQKRVVRCFGREQEVEAIAIAVRDELRRWGSEFTDGGLLEKEGSEAIDLVVIAFPFYERYAGLVRSIFREYGIPFRSHHWQSLSKTLIWEFLTNVGRVLKSSATENGRSSTPLADIDLLTGSPLLPLILREEWPHGLYRLARKRYAEASSLEELITEIELAVEKWGGARDKREPASTQQTLESDCSDTMSRSDFGAEEGDDWALRFVEGFETNLLPCLNKIEKFLADFRTEKTISEWHDRLKQILSPALCQLGVSVAENADSLKWGKTADDFRHVSAAVARILAAARRHLAMAKALGCNSYPMSFHSYLEQLSYLVEQDRVADRIRTEQGIQIYALSEIVGVRARKLFVGGLVEGEMPWLGLDGSEISSGPGGAENLTQLYSRQRYLFDQLEKVASEEIILFFPEHDEGTDLLPSQFLEDFRENENANSFVSRFSTRNDSSRKRLRDWICLRSKTEIPGTNFSELFSYPEELKNALWVTFADHAILSSPQLTCYEGRLTSPYGCELLKGFVDSQPFSVRALQELLSCPLRYFFQWILGVRPLPEMEALEAMEIGAIVHAVLYDFMSQNPEELDADELATATAKVLKEWKVPEHSVRWRYLFTLLFAGHQIAHGVSELPVAGRLGYLTVFLKREKALRGTSQQFKTQHCEWQFGLKKRTGPGSRYDAASREDPILLRLNDSLAIRLSGKIDRIDVDPQELAVRVFDYKTGRIPSLEQLKLKQIEQPIGIQLLLYAMAVKNANLFSHITQLEMGCYGLKQSSRKRDKLVQEDTLPPPDLLQLCSSQEDNLKRRLAERIEGLAKGEFPPLAAAAQKTDLRCCDGCPFYRKCCPGESDEVLVDKMRRCTLATEGEIPDDK